MKKIEYIISDKLKKFANLVVKNLDIKSYFEYLYIICENDIYDINMNNDGSTEIIKEDWLKNNLYNECLNDFTCWYDENDITDAFIKDTLTRWKQNKIYFDKHKQELIKEYKEME